MVTSSFNVSPSCQAVLDHLKLLKPSEGWTIEKNETSTSVRLLRRKVPLTDNYFQEITIANNGCVVGVISTNTKQAQILVDEHGNPCRKVQLVTLSSLAPPPPKQQQQSATSNSSELLTEAQNRDVLLFGGAVIITAVTIKLILLSLGSVILFIPLSIYMVLTCPDPITFDAKKELKRILRGYHLPENHPDKPKGFFSETVARLQATIATEVATLPGYTVQTLTVAQAFVWVSVRVDAIQQEFYWIGAFDRWWYVRCRSSTNTTTVH
jgi:hypothetical protein